VTEPSSSATEPAQSAPAPGAQLAHPEVAPVPSARRLTAEIWIVLGLSVGSSAVYALVALLDRLTREIPLGDQATALNPARNERPWLDLTYQLSAHGRSAVRRIGLTLARPGRDLLAGLGLAAVIGVPGLAFYALGRLLGITVQIQAATLDPHWWAVPVLLLSAARAALLEEVIAVGYLMERLRDLRWRVPAMITASALLRGSYHLYQGVGPFIGNAVMGAVFAWFYQRSRRVMPLVIAHFLLDLVAFVGYLLLPRELLESLGVR
jgi:membrane protease YdiL (CAAX protease family)